MHYLAFFLCLLGHVALIAIFAKAMAPVVWESESGPMNLPTHGDAVFTED